MMIAGEWRFDVEIIVKDGGKIENLWLLQFFFEIKNVSYSKKKPLQNISQQKPNASTARKT